jgi:membrane protease subunit (stomatin/prohibitin family)
MKITAHHTTGNRGLLVALTASVLLMTSYSPSAAANHGGAFVGGMIAGHLISGAVDRDKQRTADANQMAAQQTAAPAAQTPEQRIQQLDKLAAGGYITPAEYKAKKQAIIDSM